MLSRVADALYWMSRYLERVETASRVIDVTAQLVIDLADVEPDDASAAWRAALEALTLGECTEEGAVFDANDPASIITCMARARENARQVREIISVEMWEQINEAYWRIEEAAGGDGRAEDLSETLSDVRDDCFTFQGITDGTMSRGEGWLFIKMGQFVERSERTLRLIRASSQLAGRASARADDPVGESLPWLTLLRHVASLETYRKRFPSRADAKRVSEFVLLEREHPRTVRYCVSVAQEFAKRLAQRTAPRGAPVGRAFGRVASRVEFAEPGEYAPAALQHFVGEILGDLDRASMTLQSHYFRH